MTLLFLIYSLQNNKNRELLAFGKPVLLETLFLIEDICFKSQFCPLLTNLSTLNKNALIISVSNFGPRCLEF